MRRGLLLSLLAMTAVGHAQVTYRDTRPIRGTWLQPNGTMSELEIALQRITNAGITDLYLDTLWHGQTTGQGGVFNQRYPGYDYLADAINMATRYGVRVHAWMEASYWQYNTGGAYLFTANPEYRAINVATGTFGGDQAGQVFANLTHPGVRAKMRAYTNQLASTYNGLWGIETDYHRFPVDNSTSDNFPSPWGYDSVSQAAFSASIGVNVNLSTQAARTSHPYYSQFLNWRRAQISEAARQMYLGIKDARPDVVFSGAVFPTPYSSTEVSKCQAWDQWTAGGYLDHVNAMCYAPSLTGLETQVNTAKTLLNGKRFAPGLAVVGTGTKPPLVDQVTTLDARSVEDFVVWYFTYFGVTTNQDDLRNYILNNATKMRADVDNNREIDARDWSSILALYRGNPVTVSPTLRLDTDANGVFNSLDHARFRQALFNYRVSEIGGLTAQRRSAFQAQFTGPLGDAGPNNLFDFDGDNDVDEVDRQWMEFSAAPVIAFATIAREDVPAAGETFTVEFRQPGTETVVASVPVTADSAGRVLIPVPSSNATYDISLKPTHWLRRTINVAFNGNDIGSLSFNLLNGDVDGDNTVSILDYLELSNAYDTQVGDPGYNSNADLDEDGFVSVLDYLIVSSRFETNGDGYPA
jgi:uncharacterized lipoprotein YddW (UPF0748 family)